MKRRWGIVLLTVAAAALAMFVIIGLGALSTRPPCAREDRASERCLMQSVEEMDPPLLWLLPLSGGIAGAAGLTLLREARTAPPDRAVGTTWEDFLEG